jgi:Major Facilitator Superfamily
MVPLCINLDILPTSLVDKLTRIDWIGSLIFIGSATGFMMGISWGGVQYSWSSWSTIVPIVIGFLGFIGFYFYEDVAAVEPIVPTRIFKTRNAIAGYLNTILHNMIVLSLVYFLPLYYQGVKGYNTTITGVAVFPETFTVAPVAVITGILIGKFSVFRWAAWSGWAVTVFGMGILFLLDVNTSTVEWILLNLIPGLGTGALYPALQFSIQSACADEDLAAAVSMYSFFRSLGQTLGVAIGGVVLQNQLVIKIGKYPKLAAHAVEYGRDASGLARILSAMPPSQDKMDLVQAYADSLKMIWVVMCGLAGLGLLVSLLIKDYPLDRFVVPEKALDGEDGTDAAFERDTAILQKA